MAKKIYGTLETISVELPFETKAEKAKADKTNKELAHLGFRTVRLAYDWGYRPAAAKGGNAPRRLQSGDLVKIFKTVSRGTKLWEGTVDYDRSKYHHGLQRGMSAHKWSHMFHRELPARLVQDGKTIFGALLPFAETGTEGIIWSVHEYGKSGYDGLNCLKEGDQLTVYSRVTKGDVEWEGPVAFGPEKIEKIGWSEVMRASTHMGTENWLNLTWQRRPVVITPK